MEQERIHQNTYSIEEIKAIVSPIAKKYGLRTVYLFGSYARGDAAAASDIDLRIEKGRLRGAFALCQLYADMESALGKEVDVLTTGSLDKAFLESIRREEVLLYEGR